MFRNSTDIQFDVEMNIDESIDETISLNIYRIICELTANSINHASCSEIFIELAAFKNQYYIRYVDNGIGINIGAQNFNHGIKNIQSRVNYLSGKIDLITEPGKTEYIIKIPKQL